MSKAQKGQGKQRTTEELEKEIRELQDRIKTFETKAKLHSAAIQEIHKEYIEKMRALLRADEAWLWEPALRYLLKMNPFNVFGTTISLGEDKLLVVHVKPNFKSYAFRNGDMGIEQVEFNSPHKVLK